MDLQIKIEERISELEKNVEVYNNFVNDPSSLEDDKKVVAFKLFYDMVACSTLSELIGAPSKFALATGFIGVAKYVDVVGGKVVISAEYKEMLKMKNDFLTNNKN